jgi:hypothetical protein
MQRGRISQIGILLITIGLAFVFLWWYSIGYLFLGWFWSYRVSALTLAALMAGPPAALTLAGFVFYAIGRKAFWAIAHQKKGLLALLGLALMVGGGFFVSWFWAFSAYAANKLGSPYSLPLSYYLATNSPYFILFALWILSGLLIFADAIDAIWTAKRMPDSAGSR